MRSGKSHAGKSHGHARKACVNDTRRYLLRTALGLAVAAELHAQGTLRKQNLTIDAGAAAEALGELIRQTGLQILFESDAIRDHTTHAVRGEHDVAEALRKMLDGSGLVFEFINDRTVAVRPELAPPASKDDSRHPLAARRL